MLQFSIGQILGTETGETRQKGATPNIGENIAASNRGFSFQDILAETSAEQAEGRLDDGDAVLLPSEGTPSSEEAVDQDPLVAEPEVTIEAVDEGDAVLVTGRGGEVTPDAATTPDLDILPIQPLTDGPGTSPNRLDVPEATVPLVAVTTTTPVAPDQNGRTIPATRGDGTLINPSTPLAPTTPMTLRAVGQIVSIPTPSIPMPTGRTSTPTLPKTPIDGRVATPTPVASNAGGAGAVPLPIATSEQVQPQPIYTRGQMPVEPGPAPAAPADVRSTGRITALPVAPANPPLRVTYASDESAVVPQQGRPPGAVITPAESVPLATQPQPGAVPTPLSPARSITPVPRDVEGRFARAENPPSSPPPPARTQPQLATAPQVGVTAPINPTLGTGEGVSRQVFSLDAELTPDARPVSDLPAQPRVMADGSVIPRAELARHVSAQLAEVMQRGGSRPVELHLNPVELGRVKMSVKTIEGAVIVQVVADRPETLELMRRHADLLAEDFRAIGYGKAEFSFAQHGSGQGANPFLTDQAQPGEETPLADPPVQSKADRLEHAGPALSISDRVDIRI